MLTQEALRAAGFQHRLMNRVIDEWYIPLFGKDDAPLSNCLTIRFNEYRDKGPQVYLIAGPQLAGAMVRLGWVETMEEVLRVVEALRP